MFATLVRQVDKLAAEVVSAYYQHAELVYIRLRWLYRRLAQIG
jgi:hypothetical protein